MFPRKLLSTRAVWIVTCALTLCMFAQSARAQGELAGDVPAAGGTGLVTWGGGSVESLVAAARSRGCDLASAWTINASSEFTGFVVDAPTFVNAAFAALYPGNDITAGVPLLIVCRRPVILLPGDGSPRPTILAGIPVSAVVRGLSTAQLQVTVSLPEAASIPSVTAVRLCARLGSGDTCTAATFQSPGPQDYALGLPSVGTDAEITAQLCNASGCGAFLHAAQIASGTSFYAIGLAYLQTDQIFVRGIDRSISAVGVVYADGLSWDAPCASEAFACDRGAADLTISPSATITARRADGSIVERLSLMLRPT